MFLCYIIECISKRYFFCLRSVWFSNLRIKLPVNAYYYAFAYGQQRRASNIWTVPMVYLDCVAFNLLSYKQKCQITWRNKENTYKILAWHIIQPLWLLSYYSTKKASHGSYVIVYAFRMLCLNGNVWTLDQYCKYMPDSLFYHSSISSISPFPAAYTLYMYLARIIAKVSSIWVYTYS